MSAQTDRHDDDYREPTDAERKAIAAEARATADPKGNHLGIIEWGKNTLQDDIVSSRWVAFRLMGAGSAAAELKNEDDPDIDLGCVAHRMQWAFGLYAAWATISRPTNGRARAGDLFDVADLFVAGHGPIRDLVTSVMQGAYGDARRDGDGYLILNDDQPEASVEKESEGAGSRDTDIFTVTDAADILERNLRSHTRALEARPPGDDAFEWFASAVDKTRSTLTGAVAWLALSQRGARPVKARDLGDVMDVHTRHGGSIGEIAKSVLAGDYREHARDLDGGLVFDGISRMEAAPP